MKKMLIDNKHYLVVIAIGLLLAACGVIQQGGNTSYDYEPGSQESVSNGERIYFTATNNSGDRITFSGGPVIGGGMMSGGFLTCASCHGPEARGGVHVMHMTTMNAPDIRYATLSGEEGEHGEGGGEGGEEHGAGEYDLETFRLAVVEGKHPNGDSLSNDMPRWRMSDADLADLLAFLEEIP